MTFLTTHVKKPDEDDWGKLKRLLNCMKGTIYVKLLLTVGSMYIVRLWVNAFYNNHEHCKGHTGSMMSLGKVAVVSYSKKQKLNV